MKQLMLLLEESQASKEAKAKGLEYLGYGRYGKKGKTTHTVEKGRLVPVKKSAIDPETEKAKNDLYKSGKGPKDTLAPKKKPLSGSTPKVAQQQDFNTMTDTWFDDLSSFGTGDDVALNKAIMSLRYLTGRSPTANTLQQVRKVLPALGAVGKKAAKQVDMVLSNGFKGEFKKQFGEHSQASELLSMLRQAALYDEPQEEDGMNDKLVDQILDQQEKIIEKRYGKRAMQNANYGNVADDDMYGTKVYTNEGPKYLATHVGKNGKLTHQWEDD